MDYEIECFNGSVYISSKIFNKSETLKNYYVHKIYKYKINEYISNNTIKSIDKYDHYLSNITTLEKKKEFVKNQISTMKLELILDLIQGIEILKFNNSLLLFAECFKEYLVKENIDNIKIKYGNEE